MARSIKQIIPNVRVPRLPEVTDEPDVFAEMTLQEHLEELRDRIMKIVFGLVPAFIFGFIVHSRVLQSITEKAQVEGLDTRSPTDPITVSFKISIYIAIAIMAPWIVYQIVAFLAPGMTRKEKRVLYSALPFVSLLLFTGVWYAWVVAIPRALWFLGSWNEEYIKFDIDANETLSFFLALMVGLGLSFQLPVLIFILAKIGIASPAKLRKWRKYAYLVLLVVSAIVTPTTDPFNLALVAVPMILLYELGILIASAFAKTGLRNSFSRPEGVEMEEMEITDIEKVDEV
jgi:sec-independent protein translocase protein TatC